MNETILVVDDEKEVADLIELYLKNDGYSVCKYYNGTDALQCIEKTKLDLAILDVMLPDIDGFHICRKIREKYYYPIIMLTARIEDGDKILGLTIGADDYITKPFNPLEVVARVKTQLRRYTRYNQAGGAANAAGTAGNAGAAGTAGNAGTAGVARAAGAGGTEQAEYDIRGLTINRETHKAILFGKELSLTPIEFAILWYLCAHQGTVVPSEELFEAVWGEKFYHSNNTVMAHIGRLREKMQEPAKKPKFIKTVWGVGYTVEK